MSNTYNVRIEGNIDLEVLVASFGYEYEETFDHLKHAPLEYVAKYFHGGGESFIELLSNCVASFFQNRNSTAWQISLKILYVRNSKHHCPGISCQMVEQRLLTLV
jgi:hypothetical protein